MAGDRPSMPAHASADAVIASSKAPARRHPVSAALVVVLEKLFARTVAAGVTDVGSRAGVTHLVVNYAEAFDDLWRLDPGFLNWLSTGSRTVVIVWDRALEGRGRAVDVAVEHTTPIDWAVTAMLLVARSNPASDCQWQVIVIDVAGNAGPVRRRMSRPLLSGSASPVSMVTLVEADRLDKILPALLAEPTFRPTEDHLVVAKALWTVPLVAAADADLRHAVANIVGPQALLVAMKGIEDHERGPVGALRHLLHALDLVSDDREQADVPWVKRAKWIQDFDGFVLIDDLHDAGWTEVLRLALELSGEPRELLVASAPDERVFGDDGAKSLWSLCVDKVDGHDRLRVGQGVQFTSDGNRREVLFLDLRLFTRRGRDEERAWLNRLVGLAHRALAVENQLAWPAIRRDEIDAVEAWLREGAPPADRRHLLATCFLPRLIAFVDPHLPIIIFSSTTQKLVAELLRPYGNIITGFAKPAFFGLRGPVAAETRTRFRRALSAARRIARGRQVCRELSVDPGQSGTDGPRGPWLEIYIDESGSEETPVMRVGGLAIGYPSVDAAAKFSRTLRDEGLVWGFDCDSPADLVPAQYQLKRPPDTSKARLPGGEFPPDRRLMRQTLARIDSLAAKNGLSIGAFDVSVAAGPYQVLPDEEMLPNWRYRRLLRMALEIALFEWPAILHGRPKLAIYPGTRILCRDPATLQEAQYRWGLNIKNEPHNPPPRAYLFSADDVHPIVSDVLMRRRHDRIRPEVVLAKAVRLAYYENTPSRPRDELLGRQIHYAADWVASFPGEAPPSWFQNGFRDVLDGALIEVLSASAAGERALAASTAAERAEVVEAVASWADAAPHLPRMAMEQSCARWIRARVAKCAADLSGDEFAQLCERLRD